MREQQRRKGATMHKAEDLPKQQRDALEYIKVHLIAHGKAPTLEEIGNSIGSKKQNVRRMMIALEKKRFIERDPYSHRSIKLLDGGAS